MLNRKRLALLALPALLSMSACSTQGARNADADSYAVALAQDTQATEAAADAQEQRRARHLEEITSRRSELLSRRNGIESEPDMHQPDVVADPN